METDIKDLKLIMTGPDGRGGVNKEITLLTQSSTNLVGTVKDLTVEVSKLRDARIQEQTREQTKDELDERQISKRQYIITSIIAGSAILVTILIAVLF